MSWPTLCLIMYASNTKFSAYAPFAAVSIGLAAMLPG